MSAALVVGLLYGAIGSLRFRQGRLQTSDHARAHLAVILACLAIAIAWGAALDPAEVVAGFHGVVDQTAISVRLPTAGFVVAVGLATAIASLMWGWRDRPNLVLGSWAALLLAVAACYAIVPGVLRASRTTDETPLRQRRAAMEQIAFALTPIDPGPPPAFPAVDAAGRAGGVPLWDAGRVAMALGRGATAIALSPSPPGWLVVPLAPTGAPRIAVETDAGLAALHAPVRSADTVIWFGPGITTFAVASPDTWPALQAAGIPLRGSLRRAALAWALDQREWIEAHRFRTMRIFRTDRADVAGTA